eukprot:9473566-Heterocapsa_arctica.AAC.1
MSATQKCHPITYCGDNSTSGRLRHPSMWVWWLSQRVSRCHSEDASVKDEFAHVMSSNSV